MSGPRSTNSLGTDNVVKDLVFFPTVCRRVSDGTLWEPSHPGHPGFMGWYFRQIIKIWGPVWRRTGAIWRLKDKGKNFMKFEIVSWRHPGQEARK